MTTIHMHHTRRLIAVLAGALALAGITGTAVHASTDSRPVSPAPAAAQATTAWLAANR